ncbi:hypothetical protein [Pleionea litopenaei]|uniref:Uncharacterized protein n=1 Tax=Pleionea litopenaei TaxID=3070815 RepID=A0AA51X5C9_9GAMM|nr:hypothetical protein [Pleionea sp. HL-JVS1]WMS85927.1 hypothetical protein Q9312_11930 [Pleionea sp. HL-JVS1]
MNGKLGLIVGTALVAVLCAWMYSNHLLEQQVTEFCDEAAVGTFEDDLVILAQQRSMLESPVTEIPSVSNDIQVKHYQPSELPFWGRQFACIIELKDKRIQRREFSR